MRKKVSIVIVHYKVIEHLLNCIDTIKKFTKKITYEIIVIDNDEVKRLDTILTKRHPDIKYISNNNQGFGDGVNTGASIAKGSYLFVLNPDTLLTNNCLDSLVEYADTHKKAGIIAPVLLDKDGKQYPQQGLPILTPVYGIFALSFINRLWPNNKISKAYWNASKKLTKIKEVGTVPGTAFLIRKELFDEIGGFDKKFFLFFEEMDLCKRIKDLGYSIVMMPKAKVIHLWGESTKQKQSITSIFKQSRFYYFKKHFGLLPALVVEVVTRFGKVHALITGVILLSLVLSFYRLSETMHFIGDQGWFYLSARDMLSNWNIPLVGIPSSHPWLHQGAYWTYLLAIALYIGNFHPVAGGILSALIGVFTVMVIYFVGRQMFTWQVGIVSSLLYAVSPLTNLQARMPYHTNPIPLLSIVYFYFLYKWVNNNTFYFPLSIFLLAVLYNFEIATITLCFPLFFLLLYGIWKKERYTNGLFTIKNTMFSLAAFLLPMLPMLIYDLTHGFPQTIKVAMWIGYRILLLFGYPPLSPQIQETSFLTFFEFTLQIVSKLLFAKSLILTLLLLAISFAYFLLRLISEYKENKLKVSNIIILLYIVFGAGGYVINKVKSEAYLPMLFPLLFLIIAIFIAEVIKKNKTIGLVLLGVIIFTNLVSLSENIRSPHSLTQRIQIVDKIVHKVGTKPFQLRGDGEGSQFRSFTMNYEYLLWWRGVEPVENAESVVTIVEEKENIRYEIESIN